jgi:5-methylcytosine-specific restriction endonuclease McrA
MVKTYHSPEIRTLVLAGIPPVWLFHHKRRRYVEQKIRATPPWVSHREMLELHVERNRRSEETGMQHVLDHIVPLNHPSVCGLNVPWNMQILTKAQNAAKGNRWHPDQLELL